LEEPNGPLVLELKTLWRDGITHLVTEGVESLAEYAWFAEHGVRLFQGYLFAKPGFESLPREHFPNCD
jgi:EAL domain-containing protein (putative c-di-GMP-specific phosphodiesterase class I)